MNNEKVEESWNVKEDGEILVQVRNKTNQPQKYEIIIEKGATLKSFMKKQKRSVCGMCECVKILIDVDGEADPQKTLPPPRGFSAHGI